MGRRRKAWLENGNGIVHDRVKRAGKSILIKRPGYHVRYREYQVGRTIHHRKKFDTLRHAKRFASRYNARETLGLIDEIIPVTLLEAQREFLQEKTAVAVATQQEYATALLQLARFTADVELLTLTPDILRQFFADAGKTNSQATLNKKARHLNVFFVWATDKRYLTANPLPSVPTVSRDSVARKRPHIAESTLAKLLAHVDNASERLCILLAATTGMDRDDIQRLTPESIDLDNKCIRGIRTKTGKEGVDELHPSIVRELRPLLDRSKPGQRLLPGLYYQQKSAEGKWEDWWKRLCRRAGVQPGHDGLLFRDLRAYVTRWLMRGKGMTLFDAQRKLRHSSIETTVKHYNMPDPTVAGAIRRLPLPGGRVKGKSPRKAAKQNRISPGAKRKPRRRATS